jgi:hypothetical protein
MRHVCSAESARPEPVAGRAQGGSWFDKPTTSAGVVCVCLLLLSAPAHAAALDVQITDIQASAAAVRTTIELRDIVPDRFKKIVDDGRVLHLRVQAELWESRPVWDRLVYPAIVRVFRLGRGTSGRDVSITDAEGAARTYSAIPSPLPVVVDLGNTSRLGPAEKYYVHVVATLGTLAERDVDDVGDAVFGRDSDASGLGALGRLVFKTALKVSDYLQSVSAESKSRKVAGADILRKRTP